MDLISNVSGLIHWIRSIVVHFLQKNLGCNKILYFRYWDYHEIEDAQPKQVKK